MTANTIYKCPHCHAETKAKFDIGEHFADLMECPECSTPVSLEAFKDMEIDAVSSIVDKINNA